MYAVAFFISGFLELHLSVSDIFVILGDTVKAIKSLRLQLMILSLAHLFIIPRLRPSRIMNFQLWHLKQI